MNAIDHSLLLSPIKIRPSVTAISVHLHIENTTKAVTEVTALTVSTGGS
jgi:hypothetical protein